MRVAALSARSEYNVNFRVWHWPVFLNPAADGQPGIFLEKQTVARECPRASDYNALCSAFHQGGVMHFNLTWLFLGLIAAACPSD
jgi:hypothetical protein